MAADDGWRRRKPASLAAALKLQASTGPNFLGGGGCQGGGANSPVCLNDAEPLQRGELKVRTAPGKTRLPADSLRSRDSAGQPVSQGAWAGMLRGIDASLTGETQLRLAHVRTWLDLVTPLDSINSRVFTFGTHFNSEVAHWLLLCYVLLFFVSSEL